MLKRNKSRIKEAHSVGFIMLPEDEKQRTNGKKESNGKRGKTQTHRKQTGLRAQDQRRNTPNEGDRQNNLPDANKKPIWLMRPIRWFRQLNSTDKFASLVALFTGLLLESPSFRRGGLLPVPRTLS